MMSSSSFFSRGGLGVSNPSSFAEAFGVPEPCRNLPDRPPPDCDTGDACMFRPPPPTKQNQQRLNQPAPLQHSAEFRGILSTHAKQMNAMASMQRRMQSVASGGGLRGGITMEELNNLDMAKWGLGGAGEQMRTITQDVLRPAIAPKDAVNRLNAKPVRGVLLDGPPGTGKTLFARCLRSALPNATMKCMNGAEAMNKYIGESSRQINAMFQEARDAEANGDEQFFIFFIDEIDAMASRRSDGNEGAASKEHNAVVAALLTNIDGLNSSGNFIVIGATNRKDALDPALLRGGRLERHITFSLPDEHGRLEILQIHTKHLQLTGALDADVDLAALAQRTRSFTGAELQLLVKTACSRALADHHNYIVARQRELDPASFTINMHSLTLGSVDAVSSSSSSSSSSSKQDMSQFMHDLLNDTGSTTTTTTTSSDSQSTAAAQNNIVDIGISAQRAAVLRRVARKGLKAVDPMEVTNTPPEVLQPIYFQSGTLQRPQNIGLTFLPDYEFMCRASGEEHLREAKGGVLLTGYKNLDRQYEHASNACISVLYTRYARDPVKSSGVVWLRANPEEELQNRIRRKQRRDRLVNGNAGGVDMSMVLGNGSNGDDDGNSSGVLFGGLTLSEAAKVCGLSEDEMRRAREAYDKLTVNMAHFMAALDTIEPSQGSAPGILQQWEEKSIHAHLQPTVDGMVQCIKNTIDQHAGSLFYTINVYGKRRSGRSTVARAAVARAKMKMVRILTPEKTCHMDDASKALLLREHFANSVSAMSDTAFIVDIGNVDAERMPRTYNTLCWLLSQEQWEERKLRKKLFLVIVSEQPLGEYVNAQFECAAVAAADLTDTGARAVAADALTASVAPM